jgi:hypothetical protein
MTIQSLDSCKLLAITVAADLVKLFSKAASRGPNWTLEMMPGIIKEHVLMHAQNDVSIPDEFRREMVGAALELYACHLLETLEEIVKLQELHKPEEVAQKIQKAFEVLHKMGYEVGYGGLPHPNHPKKGCLGYVYAAYRVDHTRKVETYINYFYAREDGSPFFGGGDEALKVGEAAFKVLTDCGVPIEWDHSPQKFLHVKD